MSSMFRSNLATKIKNVVMPTEEQIDSQVKILRSDNGGEYKSKVFSKFCKEEGISRQHTNPYCPEQNGVAERFNRTIIESARSMLIHAKLPLVFWAEACDTAVYTHNRSPTTSLKDKTPFECLFGRKPNVSHLRVFSCLTYVLIPQSQRKKLDAKAHRAIFVCYPPGIKGYKLYDKEKDSFTISRNVKFLETTFDCLDNSKSGNVIDTDFENCFNDTDEKQEDFVPEIPAAKDDDHEEQVGAPPLQHEEDAPVQRTYEDAFMEEVRNLRPIRERKLPTRYKDEECLAVNSLTANIDEPESVKEALNGQMSKNWEEAMNNEYESLLTNGTWDLVPLPKGANVLGSRWVFKVNVMKMVKLTDSRQDLLHRGTHRRKVWIMRKSFPLLLDMHL